MPKLYIISGCNGAGKTTGSLTVLPEMLSCKEFVKAYSNLVTERAERNETLVVFMDGKVQHVPAKELLHTIVQE